MDNPGIQSLGDFPVGQAATQTGAWVVGLAGMLSATLQARLAYGSGGTTARLYFQTSLDGGTTAIDIACVLFGTAGEMEVINLSGLTPKTTQIQPTDGGLADDTAIDGVLGDRLRCKVISTGTYAGQTVLSVRAVCR